MEFPTRYRSKCRAAQRMRIIRSLSLKIIANSKGASNRKGRK